MGLANNPASEGQPIAALVLARGTAVLPDRLVEDAAVVCESNRISGIGSRTSIARPEGAVEVDCGGGYIVPGFVDIHVHGGGGADVMDGSVDDVLAVARAHARHGTTTLFPTTTTGSPERLEAMLEACRELRDGGAPRSGARIAGVHLYGPFFAADKIGCHPAGGTRDPHPDEYRPYFDLDIVSIATAAAELPGAEAYYREAVTRGCLVTCAHSNASWTEMARGFAAGVRHVDHFWCAMSSIPSVAERLGTPMQGSMAEFVLMHDAVSTEVIADGCHLAPELLEFAYRMKGVARLCLVTDSSRALDMPPGEYVFGPRGHGEPFVSDGRVGRTRAGDLASSVRGMDHMVRTMFEETSASLVDAIRMASLTPAERAGVAHEVGSLERGKRADIVVLDRDFSVRRVFVGGVELEIEPAALDVRS